MNDCGVRLDRIVFACLWAAALDMGIGRLEAQDRGVAPASERRLMDTSAGGSGPVPVSWKSPALPFGRVAGNPGGVAAQTAVAGSASAQIHIEAEDFDFDGGQHRPEADVMPYLGGAYAGLSAVAGVDYNDPGANESAEYRAGSQGVALGGTDDRYRDGYDVTTNYRIGWTEAGEWYQYTRVFPLPARDYLVYARMGSGALSNAVQLDIVTSGVGTTNPSLSKVGEARGPASGWWLNYVSVPFRDPSGRPARVRLGGKTTLRLTVLPESNQDINYLQFVPADEPRTVPCSAPTTGLVARWRAEGSPAESHAGTTSEPHNGIAYAEGRVGQAFQLDGIDDFVGTMLDVQPSAMPTTTWEGWVFPKHPFGRQQILSSDDGGFDRSVGVEGNFFGVFVGNMVWAPTTLSLNQWQHIAVIYSPTNVLFFKNGVRFALGRPAPGQATGYRFQIGRNPGFGEYFQGLIDELSIYDRALSDEEIQALACWSSSGGPADCPTVQLSPGSIAPGTVGLGYNQSLSAGGGSAPYEYSITGDLPDGLSFASSGVLAGTPSAAGEFRFTVRAMDSVGCAGETAYVLRIDPGADPGSGSVGTRIDLLTPSRGAPGDLITVGGVHFAANPAGNTVRFGGLMATVSGASSTQLVVRVPEAAPVGLVRVTVAVVGQGSASSEFLVQAGAVASASLLRYRLEGRTIQFSWSGLNQRLQSTEGLIPPIAWRDAPGQPALIAGLWSQNVSPEGATQFYRLIGPGTIDSGVSAEEPVFESVEEAQGTLTPAAGAVLRLGNSATFEIPAGAVSTNTPITVRRLDLASFNAGLARDVYRVEAGAVAFQRPATLTLPFPAGTSTGAVHVFRSSPEGGTDELEASVDPVSGLVRVTTDRFSDIVVEEDSTQSAAYWRVRGNAAVAGRLLSVPFYPQGQTYWCFAAASQMMFKYYGKDVEAWDVGRHFGVTIQTGPKPTALYGGSYSELFEKNGVKVRDISTWVFAPNINGYIIRHLDAGRPVFVIVGYGVHAVVVVGYDHRGFYVHDPSGYSVKLANPGGLSPNGLAGKHFTWDEWKTAMFGQKIRGWVAKFPLPVWTVALDGAVSAQPPATVSLLSSVLVSPTQIAQPYLEISRPQTGLPPVAGFLWDGTKPTGYQFFPGTGFKPEHLANSDEMVLWVHLNNGGTDPVTGTLSLKLSDKVIFSSPTPEIIPGSNSLVQRILFDPSVGGPYRFKTGSAGLLKPGNQELRVELSSGGEVIDTIPIRFQIAPAKPENVKVAPEGAGVKLTWDRNREEAVASIMYDVYRDGQLITSTSLAEYTDARGSLSSKYQLVAVDVEHYLESPPADPVISGNVLTFVRQGTATILSTAPDPRGEEVVSITDTGVQVTFNGKSGSISWDAPPAEIVVDLRYPFVFRPSWTRHEVDGAGLGAANANSVFLGAIWFLNATEPRPPIASDPSRVNNSFWMSSGYYFTSECNCFRRDVEPWSWPTQFRGPDTAGRDYYLQVEIQTARQYTRMYWKYTERKP